MLTPTFTVVLQHFLGTQQHLLHFLCTQRHLLHMFVLTIDSSNSFVYALCNLCQTQHLYCLLQI